MHWSEFVFGSGLIVFLIIVAAVLGQRQLREFRRLRTQSLPDDEMRWERRKAWRRLVSAGLLVLMAGLLSGLLVFYEPTAGRLAEERAGLAEGEGPALTDAEKTFLRIWGGLLISLLLVLLAVVMLAGIDLWATRRYGITQLRKLQADRRAMIERQTVRMRQERNGHG